ncbi:MAG: hypothetical protein AXA67_10610 [Methylothermaceae bacteria B42]|nr:MAG: hypothetical protein AXA67_10610 [Methylothermaceae bacteria B42]
MLGHFQLETWNRGTLVEPSSLIERFHLILEGRVKIEYIDAESGDQVILFIMGPGEGFDVITLLDGQPHSITPVVLDDLLLLTTSMQTVREWINRYPEFNRNFLPYLGEQMRALEELAMDLATKDTATRLARLILRHTIPDSTSEKGPHTVRLIHDLSHDALAHMIGSTRQVVNRHLQALRHKGILAGQTRHRVVMELEALKLKAEKFLSHDFRI